MITFNLIPGIGPIPLRFGMTPDQVAFQIGPPVESFAHQLGCQIEKRQYFELAYSVDEKRLIEAVFAPGACLLFEGDNLFNVSDPIRILSEFDSTPYLWVGFVVFQKLGIQLSGFHDNDESQKAIAVVAPGYWDEYITDFVPYSMNA